MTSALQLKGEEQDSGEKLLFLIYIYFFLNFFLPLKLVQFWL